MSLVSAVDLIAYFLLAKRIRTSVSLRVLGITTCSWMPGKISMIKIELPVLYDSKNYVAERFTFQLSPQELSRYAYLLLLLLVELISFG